MFTTGQKVICIDDKFPALIFALYDELPYEGQVYTVRAVYVGRGDPLPETPGGSDGEIGLLLAELHNAKDPASKSGGELGFRADRFRALEETVEVKQREMETANR